MVMHAEISLAAEHAPPLGEPRIALLEAVGREGSISAAARSLGLSYRGAWDAICAMNSLVGCPLVAGQVGGPRGGGAQLTPDGLRLIEGYRRLQAEMARAFNAVAPDLAGKGGEAVRLMLAGFRRTSARNALRGRIVFTREGTVGAEVGLQIAEGAILQATLTRRSLRDLGLFPGKPAIALVKAPMIVLQPAAAAGPAAGVNRLEGIVASVERDSTATEINLDIGGQKTLCATIPQGAASPPAFAVGDRAVALIDPAHVILAVE